MPTLLDKHQDKISPKFPKKLHKIENVLASGRGRGEACARGCTFLFFDKFIDNTYLVLQKSYYTDFRDMNQLTGKFFEIFPINVK